MLREGSTIDRDHLPRDEGGLVRSQEDDGRRDVFGATQARRHRAQRILCEEEVPIIPFFVTSLNLAVAPRVQRFEPNAMDIYFLDRVSVR